MKMIRSIAIAALIAASIFAFSVNVLAPRLPRVVGRPDIIETRAIHETGVTRLLLHGHAGELTITPYEGDAVSGTATLRAYLLDGVGPDQVAAYEGRLFYQERTDDGLLELLSDPGDLKDMLELRVDCDLRVPGGIPLDIEVKNGEVKINPGAGSIKVTGQNTAVTISGPTKDVQVETLNGRIRLWDAQGNATLKTVNGRISAHMLAGELGASTTNGAIVARLLTPDIAACTLQNQNGGITVVLCDDISATVDLHTENGVAKCDNVPLEGMRLVNRRRIRGTINDGRTAIRGMTTNGNIRLVRDES